jgi:hypothetical protein
LDQFLIRVHERNRMVAALLNVDQPGSLSASAARATEPESP